MKFSLSWLKDYLDTNASVEEISATLTKIGLEVEDVIDNSATLQGFIIADIKRLKCIRIRIIYTFYPFGQVKNHCKSFAVLPTSALV